MQAISLFAIWLIAVEAVSAISAWATRSKWQASYLKWLLPYLTTITILEVGSRTFNYLGYYQVAGFIKHFPPPLEILFINWFFYQALSVKSKRVTLIGSVVYIATWVYENTIFTVAGYYFKSLSYTVGTLFILIYLIVFFIELARSDKILGIKKLAIFWVALGLLIFYLGTFPFYGLYNELAKKENMYIFYPAAWVATSLNYCMYILFTIGFIWGKPR